ncbi:MAG: hypothetical protein FJ128_11150, partial [Deltaproteobacteria bacterium]|nr:hypothetical protein [Deltaproteobacteria bacterium]
MFIPLLQAAAVFPVAGWALDRPTAGTLLFDCHHGDIFVLKATGLAAAPVDEPAAPAGIHLEAALTPPREMTAQLEGLAAHHTLALGGSREPAGELTLRPLLAAAHVPPARLFIYAEASTLTVRPGPEGRVTITVTADFKARQIPCQEADLVIHLDKAAAAQFCSFLLRRARSGW